MESGTLGGSALASWTPLWLLLGGFGLVVFALGAYGRSDPAWGGLRALSRAPDSLARLTGVPGWAATAIGTSLFGLLLAGQGFYADVAWHIGFGRDDDLFTAPHTSILVGLVLILAGAALGTLVATLDRIEDGWRIGGFRVPWSLLPLWGLGLGAIAGFPLDEVWHREYGIDVTMWSPTHMLMILGASFTGLAAWLVLADARVRPTDSAWARGLHVACGALALQGLAAPLGEFSFGVPQFSAMFAPVLVALASGIALVAMRLILGPGWTTGIAVVSLALMAGEGGGPVETRPVGIFVVSAVVVEVVAWLAGTQARTRFALLAGTAIGTVGAAGEWWWNQHAHQPWRSGLLPEAPVAALVAAIAGAVLGAGFARAFQSDGESRRAIPGAALAVAGGVAVALVLLLLPRHTGDVTVATHLVPSSDDTVIVEATISPTDAAVDAYWFQAQSWQGGGLVTSTMEATGTEGVYRSDPVPVGGQWKTLLRLHRPGQMMTVPVFLPADPSINEPEIPAVDRSGPFEPETRYLLRETTDGNGWLAPVVHSLLALVCIAWAVLFTIGVRRAGRVEQKPEPVVV